MKTSALLLCVTCTALCGGADGSEIQLLSAASMQTVFKEVIPDFERASGHRIAVRYSTMGAITERVMNGEEADLVVSSPASVAKLVAEGRISAGSEVRLAQTAVGIGVPSAGP